MPYKDYNIKMAEYMKRRYHARRAQALDLLGGKCTACGCKDDLEIDHIDCMDKEIPLTRLWSVSEERFLRELSKCQLLCREHHKEKSRTDMSLKARIREERKRRSKGL